ncbi:MAG TPA: LytR C-terminal domain-containing protein [Longimicrobiales bacterium]
MNGRLRRLALPLALLAVAVFVTSFVLGLGWSRDGEGHAAAVDARRISRASGARLRIEVLNAGGRAGMARAATHRLRDRGFDVVYYGNAEEFGRDSSVVVDRVGDLESARAVADALGIRAVATHPDSTLLLEVTVLLGKDWRPAPPERPDGWGARIGRLWRWVRGGGS